jgi:2-isopropylmalate synthase
MSNNTIKLFDTTLRDGEQSPGASMNTAEKLRLAVQLEKLGVDIIEAGFPAASDGDFDAVAQIAGRLQRTEIAGLARASKSDIDRAWNAVKKAVKPRIHTFIATSDIHLKYKLNMSREEVLQHAVEAVRYAKGFTENVEFSAEDGSRSDRDYLCKVFEAAIEAGATTINLPDTVGYAIPGEFADLVKYIMTHTPNIGKAVFSVHCHNDLGLATANTLAALNNGARQAEVTINGIGERAGNTSLEEVAMALHTRNNYLNLTSNINTEHISATSKLVSMITGIMVQPNKAIVGANAFAHEAGIHQDGMLKNPMTYEIMRPEDHRPERQQTCLGKHSGRHALRERLKDMGMSCPKKSSKLFSKSSKTWPTRKNTWWTKTWKPSSTRASCARRTPLYWTTCTSRPVPPSCPRPASNSPSMAARSRTPATATAPSMPPSTPSPSSPAPPPSFCALPSAPSPAGPTPRAK